MSLGTMDGCRMFRRHGLASKEVDLTSNRLQVDRIHAVTNTTEMIELKPYRYGAHEDLVDHLVSYTWLPPTSH